MLPDAGVRTSGRRHQAGDDLPRESASRVPAHPGPLRPLLPDQPVPGAAHRRQRAHQPSHRRRVRARHSSPRSRRKPAAGRVRRWSPGGCPRRGDARGAANRDGHDCGTSPATLAATSSSPACGLRTSRRAPAPRTLWPARMWCAPVPRAGHRCSTERRWSAAPASTPSAPTAQTCASSTARCSPARPRRRGDARGRAGRGRRHPQAIAAGQLPDNGFAHELTDVIAGRAGRSSEEQITVFKSVGVAVEDLIIARAVADRLRTEEPV